MIRQAEDAEEASSCVCTMTRSKHKRMSLVFRFLGVLIAIPTYMRIVGKQPRRKCASPSVVPTCSFDGFNVPDSYVMIFSQN